MEKPMRKQALSFLLMIQFFLLSSFAQAAVNLVEQTFDSEPHQLIQDTTKQVLTALDNGLDPVKEPKKFVDELTAILDPVVAFEFIARGVIGNYAKQVSKDQVKQFADAFKLGLVNTYGKGMANFGELEIAVLAPTQAIGDQRRLAVVQEIRGGGGTNQVSYTMAKNKKGQWKMINVVLNGVNLGQSFRGQFAAAVEKNNGDVTKTINDWGK
jgi:phospholipid transport system substrate-binding protein